MWTRVIIDNIKSLIPYKNVLRQALRTLSPYSSNPANDSLAITHGLRMIEIVRTYNVNLENVIEIGTGWMPTLPYMLIACDAERIILSDIERLCDSKTHHNAKKLVEKHIDKIAASSGKQASHLLENLSRANLTEYRVPPEFEKISSDSATFIYSRVVLEHIPKSSLIELLSITLRIMKPGAIAIHIIDNSDHFEHNDKRLSRLNFLTISDRAWRFACINRQNYQNRLRHSDYLRIVENLGFEILHGEGRADPGARSDLDWLALNAHFDSYEKDDLATLETTIVVRKRHTQAHPC